MNSPSLICLFSAVFYFSLPTFQQEKLASFSQQFAIRTSYNVVIITSTTLFVKISPLTNTVYKSILRSIHSPSFETLLSRKSLYSLVVTNYVIYIKFPFIFYIFIFFSSFAKTEFKFHQFQAFFETIHRLLQCFTFHCQTACGRVWLPNQRPFSRLNREKGVQL